MIPKKIFFFWGDTNISWLRYMTLKSFKALNPSWKITLYLSSSSEFTKTWEEKNEQDFFSYTGEDYFSKIKQLGIKIDSWDFDKRELRRFPHLKKITPSQKSNFFKWYKLATEGGIYADMDILFIKPLNTLYNKIKTADTVICHKEWFSIGFLASSPDNEFFKNIYNNAKNTFTLKQYQSAGVKSIYNHLWKHLPNKEKESFLKLIKKYPNQLIFNIHQSLFYHYTYRELDKLFLDKNIAPDEQIGIHWYAGAPLSQEYNSKMTEENYSQFDNTISYYAKKIYELQSSRLLYS